MFRVLVCGNDRTEYEKIKKLLDQERFSESEALFSSDGIEAFGIIMNEAPDVVFTDISLSGMDGIELIRKCRENDIGCSFVIVSRFKRFDYLKSLIRFGIEDYLVKPVEGEEYERVFTDLLERQAAKSARDMNETLLRTRRSLRNAFMEAFLYDDQSVNYDIAALNEKYHFLLKEGLFRAAVISIWDLPKNELGIFLPALVQNARARFDPICYEMIPYIIGDDRMILLFNYAKESRTEEKFRDIQSALREHLHKWGCSDVSFSIGLGRAVTDIKDLRYAYETAVDASCSCVFRGTDQFFDYDTMVFADDKDTKKLLKTAEKEFGSAAELLDAEKIRMALRNRFSEMSYSTDPSYLRALVKEALKAVAAAPGAGCANDTQKSAYRATMCRNLSSIEEVIVSWAKEVFDQCRFEKRNSRPIRKAMEYIDGHYSEPLTLDHISELVHLNSSYFSIVFKKQTGRNFSEYLTQTRVEAAKKLLSESDMSIASICEEVGYLDRKYFSRVFERLVGIKPSAYRALHS